jgi:hypothetical protein
MTWMQLGVFLWGTVTIALSAFCVSIITFAAFYINGDGKLVARVVHSAGYNLLSFTRAFAVLNCQSALVCFLLRSASHASTSCFNTR